MSIKLLVLGGFGVWWGGGGAHFTFVGAGICFLIIAFVHMMPQTAMWRRVCHTCLIVWCIIAKCLSVLIELLTCMCS